MSLPLYQLIVSDENENTEIYAVSIVESPAVGFAYELFNKIERFKVENDEKQLISGVILTADTPIYRNNSLKGEHYVLFTKEVIRTAMQKFFKSGYHLMANFEHNDNLKLDNVYFFESYQIDKERGINPPKGYEDVPDGSWMGTMKIDDKDTWNKIKEGKFTGFSVEGVFEYGETPVKIDEEFIKVVDELITKIEQKIV